MPSSSRALMDHACSTGLNRSCTSVRWPSSQASWPVPQSLASVPVMAAMARGRRSRSVQLRRASIADHHSRSRKKSALSSIWRHGVRGVGPGRRRRSAAGVATRTFPRLQSTSRPRNCESMPCMYVRPPGMTCEAKTMWPRRRANSTGSALAGRPSSRRLDSQSVIVPCSLCCLASVRAMHRRPGKLRMRSPRNSMHRHGPRVLCGAHSRPISWQTASKTAARRRHSAPPPRSRPRSRSRPRMRECARRGPRSAAEPSRRWSR
mmetsp:Transcript_39061/g.126271  ORF Transcript_39061/g.126271 Transcript_39061/m.126271 type:complete len:263 (-) Transcript_39061:396-1184(-)